MIQALLPLLLCLTLLEGVTPPCRHGPRRTAILIVVDTHFALPLKTQGSISPVATLTHQDLLAYHALGSQHPLMLRFQV